MNQELHNLTKTEYQHGKWKIDNIGEDELFNLLAPNIKDLIREMEVKNTTNSEGDNYKKIIIKVHNETNFEDHGIEIKRKDYYKNLKTYCILFRYVYFLCAITTLLNIFRKSRYPYGIESFKVNYL